MKVVTKQPLLEEVAAALAATHREYKTVDHLVFTEAEYNRLRVELGLGAYTPPPRRLGLATVLGIPFMVESEDF